MDVTGVTGMVKGSINRSLIEEADFQAIDGRITKLLDLQNLIICKAWPN
jgi:hypothetical protein